MNLRAFLTVTAGLAMLGHDAPARARNRAPLIGVLPEGVYSPDPSATDIESAMLTDSQYLAGRGRR